MLLPDLPTRVRIASQSQMQYTWHWGLYLYSWNYHQHALRLRRRRWSGRGFSRYESLATIDLRGRVMSERHLLWAQHWRPTLVDTLVTFGLELPERDHTLEADVPFGTYSTKNYHLGKWYTVIHDGHDWRLLLYTARYHASWQSHKTGSMITEWWFNAPYVFETSDRPISVYESNYCQRRKEWMVPKELIGDALTLLSHGRKNEFEVLIALI